MPNKTHGLHSTRLVPSSVAGNVGNGLVKPLQIAAGFIPIALPITLSEWICHFIFHWHQTTEWWVVLLVKCEKDRTYRRIMTLSPVVGSKQAVVCSTQSTGDALLRSQQLNTRPTNKQPHLSRNCVETNGQVRRHYQAGTCPNIDQPCVTRWVARATTTYDPLTDPTHLPDVIVYYGASIKCANHSVVLLQVCGRLGGMIFVEVSSMYQRICLWLLIKFLCHVTATYILTDVN